MFRIERCFERMQGMQPGRRFATAIFFHRNFADQNQMIHFLKNVMIAGGLLQIVYFGAGPMSIDAARKQSQARRSDNAPVSRDNTRISTFRGSRE